MNEIVKEPVSQIAQSFRDRISSPLWGYVFSLGYPVTGLISYLSL